MKTKDVEIKCIACGKPLKPLEDFDVEAHPLSANFDDATVDQLYPGYGSRHDLSRFIVGICDDCIDVKLKEGLLIQDKEQEEEDWRLRREKTQRILAERL